MGFDRQDFESWKFLLRGSMHEVGRRLLERLSRGLRTKDNSGDSLDKRSRYREQRAKTIVTVLGNVTATRSYCYDRQGGEGIAALDRILDIVGTAFSRGMRRMMGRVGAYQSFGLGHD